MSDIQRDREERQHVIEVLQNMVDWMQEIDDIATPERIHALFYAIASIKTDLKYDLLYEKTSEQADKPTTKNDVPENNVGNIYICSCGYGWDKSKVVRHHFCPNCGKAVDSTTKNGLAVDAVSRQALIDWLRNWTLGDASPLIDFVSSMPPVTPQEPRWIPVSEKLPHDRDWYLGIFKEPDTGWINPLPYICDYVGRETKATTKEYWILRGFTDIDEPCDYHLNLECVAWMPLPKQFELQ